MTLFISLLPLYIFGNIHCLGMCGPLVMLIGQHRYRFWYFIGRLSSFAMAGWLAGAAGMVVYLTLHDYYIAELISLLCGTLMIVWGLQRLTNFNFFSSKKRHSYTRLNKIQKWLASLLLQDSGWTTFLFGFFTVALPCGQTLLVFSACALTGDAWIGLFNGFALAIFTTPSLFLAMHTINWLGRFKKYERLILSSSAIVVGTLAFSRGLAGIGWIQHWIINPTASPPYHFVIY